MDNKMIERLHNSQDFLAFLDEVNRQREGWISNLHDRSTEAIQQISGRICALDDVLNSGQYLALKAKWTSIKL